MEHSMPDTGEVVVLPDQYDTDLQKTPSVIVIPEKYGTDVYFNGFQSVEKAQGYMVDTAQAIIFPGTPEGNTALDACVKLLISQGVQPLVKCILSL